MSPRRNLDSPNPSLASECAPPPRTGGGHTRLRSRDWTLEESQFRRLEKKLSTLLHILTPICSIACLPSKTVLPRMFCCYTGSSVFITLYWTRPWRIYVGRYSESIQFLIQTNIESWSASLLSRVAQRWKSQRIIVHWLGYRFPLDFQITTLLFFFLEIPNIWQKSRDFWFADFFLEIFKIHRLAWIAR
jgi:hypothetical protein